MHPDTAAGIPDAGPNLQELEPQRFHLSRGQLRALEVAPQQWVLRYISSSQSESRRRSLAPTILKAAEGGLGGQIAGTLRSLAGHDLESQVSGQSRGIVIVFLSQGNGEQALPHQGQEIMFNLVGITGSWRQQAACPASR